MFCPKESLKGQALLLVLLGMGAAMVLVLSVVSRSITDISLTSKEDESARAFSAAEAGVEKVLISGSSDNIPDLGNNSGYVSELGDLAAGSTEYNIPESLKSGEFGTVWFVPHDENGQMTVPAEADFNKLTICWGNENATGEIPALELSLYYDDTPGPGTPSLNNPPDYSGVKVFRAAYDSASAGRDNGFETDGIDTECVIAGQNYPYSKKELIVASLNDLLFARIKLLYNSVAQNVGVQIKGANLPSQGKRIVSTGTSGDATRKVEVIQTYKDILPFLDNAVYSNSNLEK